MADILDIHPKIRETPTLITSYMGHPTPVNGSDGLQLGSIQRVMIEKESGRIAYAIMTSHFLGAGERYFAVPWAALRYDRAVDGYRLDVGQDQLRESETSVASDYLDMP